MRNKIVLDKIAVSGSLVSYEYHVNDGLNSFFKVRRMFIQYDEDVTDVPLSLLSVPFVSSNFRDHVP